MPLPLKRNKDTSPNALRGIEICESRVSSKLPIKTCLNSNTDADESKKCKLLVVTVNQNETQAFKDSWMKLTGSTFSTFSKNGHSFNKFGTILHTEVYHTLSKMGTSGPGAMQQTVNNAIEALQPDAIIALGIAFGIDSNKQNIGEILISNQIHLYEPQKVRKGRNFSRGEKTSASIKLLNYFTNYSQLYLTPNSPKVSSGLMLSGEKLIDDIKFKRKLINSEPEAIGGEMEAAGLYVSASAQKVEWIVIKAICDWADGEKDQNKETNQILAATNAAEFLINSLKNSSLKDLLL